MKIDIALPTYNRATFLLKNIRLIQEQLKKDNLFSFFTLSVADNCSPDQTQSEVEKFIETEKDPNFEFYYQRNSENIGLEKNTLVAMQMCNNEYIITLGDDDFFDEGYLKFVVKSIQENDNLGCIITGVMVHRGEQRLELRKTGQDFYYAKKGFEGMLNFSYLGHQLSGLTFKRKNLIESYLSFPEHRNIYLFIYFTAFSSLHHDTIFAPFYKTIITDGNTKNWAYDQSGNLSIMFKSFYPFVKDLGEEKTNTLISKLFLFNSDRLRLNPFFPFQGISNFKHLLQNTLPLPGLKSALRKTFLKIWLSSIKRKITN